MSRLAPLLLIGALSSALAACGDSEDPAASAVRKAPAPSATAAPPGAAVGELGRPAAVPGQANLFGAGRDQPPAPGDGGPGVLPTSWQLPEGARRVVTFSSVSGRVSPIEGVAPENGPEGDGIGGTDVTSFGGISGIVHSRNGMFLTGVFLTDDPASEPAPPRLNFTRREDFDSLSPRAGADVPDRRRNGPLLQRPARGDPPVPRLRRRLLLHGSPRVVRQQRGRAHRHGRHGEAVTTRPEMTGPSA